MTIEPTEQGMPVARPWLPPAAHDREAAILESVREMRSGDLFDTITSLTERNRVIHEVECLNLNPATNVMNPRAEAALSSRLGSRPSLGYPGAKYEMGLEAIEEIEVIAMHLARRVFGAEFAEIRVGSGALANLYAFMATCQPGDTIIVPSTAIGGHVTHHRGGVAGLYGLDIHAAPINPDRFTVDLDGLAAQVKRLRPKLISIGGSLNLLPHPVEEVRNIADTVGARVLFDAAHVCGLIAGRVWPNPLDQGAHLMTMSTYKSLGGPPSGLILSNDAGLAERIDAIAYPGMTANFDVSKSAALAISLLDWIEVGQQYATAMVATAAALARELHDRSIPLVCTEDGHTSSHQLAIDASLWGGGDTTASRLRTANIL
ncbi:MAG: serine hydroxymethyltransferase, partial [Acidimicrobiales bacterium]